MTGGSRCYFVRSPDSAIIVGYDDPNVAEAAALDFGEGPHLVDSQAQAYHPIGVVGQFEFWRG